MRPTTLELGDLRLEGCSRAGDETWFRLHPPGLAFDVGRGALPLSGAQDLFLSHVHLDHALGLPFILSQRTLHRLERTRVFFPREAADAVAALIAAGEAMERVAYEYTLVPLAPGDRVEVGRDLAIEAFRTVHVLPSLGFHLLRRKRRLLAAYRGLPGEEIAALRRRGVEPQEELEELALSYCGDTGPAVFELEPRLYTTRILMVECTFLTPELRDRAERYQHLHLADLEARERHFANLSIVLYHLSRRHRPEELRELVESRLPRLAERIHLMEEGK